jgi:hypothetical protein
VTGSLPQQAVAGPVMWYHGFVPRCSDWDMCGSERKLTSVFPRTRQVTIKLYEVEPHQVAVPQLHSSIQQLLQDQSLAR